MRTTMLLFKAWSRRFRLGYRLERVSTYGAALEAIRRREHDVYLLDYHLGERNGLELLQDWRGLLPGALYPSVRRETMSWVSRQ